jgi:5-(aminomethyl)-3-furanmethanol phosphate kinase
MATPEPGLTVVKLGGSFAFSPLLPAILDAVGTAAGRVALVTGGGPFADCIRDAQSRMRFDNTAAHRMALLAMAQFAEAVASQSAHMQVAANVATIRQAVNSGKVPVWSPWPLDDGLGALAWLTGKLGATRLLLLKHREPPVGPVRLRDAARDGIVDPLFPGYAARCGAAIWWLGPSRLPALAAILDGREPAGGRLAHELSEYLSA